MLLYANITQYNDWKWCCGNYLFFIGKVPLCTDPFNCFMFVLNIGMRAGGGVGDTII